eukprot:scaffold76000_cov53-Phaeocystis_antarctica.AAC.2
MLRGTTALGGHIPTPAREHERRRTHGLKLDQADTARGVTRSPRPDLLASHLISYKTGMSVSAPQPHSHLRTRGHSTPRPTIYTHKTHGHVAH